MILPEILFSLDLSICHEVFSFVRIYPVEGFVPNELLIKMFLFLSSLPENLVVNQANR